MAEINDLSTTDASNTARFPEGMNLSAVNNGARALEGMIARGLKDTIDGSATTGGTSTAYTVAIERGVSAYYDGLTLAVQWDQECGATPTINVTPSGGSALGAKSLYWCDGVQVQAGELKANARSLIQYDGTNFQILSARPRVSLVGTDISGQTEAVVASGDSIVFSDASDSGNLKRDTVQGLVDLIPSGADPLARAAAFTALMLHQVTGAHGPVYQDSFTADTLSVKTNATYSAGDDWYQNLGSATLISQGTGTAFRTFNTNAGNEYDGTTSQANSSSTRDSVASASGFNNYTGKVYSSNKTVSQAVAYSPSDVAFLNSNSADVRLEYSTDTTNGTDGTWTTLQTIASTASGGQTLTFNSFTPVSAKGVRININGNGSNTSAIAEAEFYEAGTPPNMTLRPSARTLDTADPETLLIQAVVEEVSGADASTNVKLAASIDNGTTFTTAAVRTTEYAFGDDRLLMWTVDVSAQSGSQAIWEITTENSEGFRIKQIQETEVYA